MLSACSWEGIALQRSRCKADVYCAATSMIGAGPGSQRTIPLSCSGAAWPWGWDGDRTGTRVNWFWEPP